MSRGGADSGPPTVPRSVFAQVPERDAYALALVAISPELGGTAGIAGITGPADPGRGESYSDEQVSPLEALPGALWESGVIAVLLAGALLAIGFTLGRRGTLVGPPAR